MLSSYASAAVQYIISDSGFLYGAICGRLSGHEPVLAREGGNNYDYYLYAITSV
jgi:hypothetical protein